MSNNISYLCTNYGVFLCLNNTLLPVSSSFSSTVQSSNLDFKTALESSEIFYDIGCRVAHDLNSFLLVACVKFGASRDFSRVGAVKVMHRVFFPVGVNSMSSFW